MARFAPGCNEKQKRNEMKDLNPATFPASFDDWSHQNGNLMVSKIVLIVLL